MAYVVFFFFSSRRRHTRFDCDWSSDVCSSDLTDGERALQILVSKNLQVTLILDLLHVLEKLWKAAYVFHAEGSTEAEQWVRLRAEKILEGHVSQVVQGIRQMVTKLALGGSKGKMLSSVANYLYRNRSRVHYDQYLARGDRKSTRLNSSHSQISYAVFCLKKKKRRISKTP